MSDGGPRAFYTERIPEQFNRALDEQAGAEGDGARVFEDMKAVTATLKIEVEGATGGTWYLNVEEGRMSSGDAAARDPFLTLIHDEAAFARLEREAGDSALGFLGGLAGLAGDIKLTRSRLENLAGLDGTIGFTLTGDDGFSLRTHFGPSPASAEPQCAISVDGDAYGALRAGTLDPQEAFMSGKIHVEGNVQMAMQLALAVLSPD